MKLYTMEDIGIDNRDSETTELVIRLHNAVVGSGEIRIEVTKKDLEELLQNMKDNTEEVNK